MKNPFENLRGNGPVESADAKSRPEEELGTTEERLRVAQARLERVREELRIAQERRKGDQKEIDEAIDKQFGPLVAEAQKRQRYYEDLAEKARRLSEKLDQNKK